VPNPGKIDMLNFKGVRFPIDLILVCIRWYAAYPLSYRQLEEIMQERGVSVDHSSINRWTIRFLPLIEKGSVALLSPARIFCMPSMTPAYTGRTCPANPYNWSANDMGAASSAANWPFGIMCISSIPASTEPADRNDLKLSIAWSLS
jgi:hypothetical protein